MAVSKKLTAKNKMKKIKCPQCNNDSKLKKTCVVCRGEGYVYTGKAYGSKT